jgi:hypothetical protein
MAVELRIDGFMPGDVMRHATQSPYKKGNAAQGFF